MKKVLALVLAVMMLATTAFAASDFIDGDTGDANSVGSGMIKPGTKLKYGEKDANDEGITNTKAINSTNYSISNIKYEEGKSLVESIKFNDADDLLEIKLKQDYTMTTPKELALTLVLKGKKVAKGNRPEDITLQVGQIKGVGNKLTVGYKLYDGKDYAATDSGIVIVDTDDVRLPNDAGSTKALYKVVKYDNDAGTKGTAVYGTMEMTARDTDVEIEARVYDGDKLFLYNEIDADDDILKKYADTDADITFLSFPAAPTFNATATVRFYKDEDSFVYGMKNGQLVNVNAKWDDDEGCFVLKTRTLGSYVFSDKKLSVAATTPGSENPDTGANDVVGIATALAAVALVSAAAVSLKK